MGVRTRVNGTAGLMLAAALLLALGSFAAPTQAVEIDLAMWIVEPAEIEPTLEIIRAYEAMNPGVKINLIHQPWTGYHDKMMTYGLAGTAPDVMAISRIYLGSFAEANLLRPLTSEIEPLLDEVIEIQSGMHQGEIYGIPVWGGPSLWMYNGGMFDQAGLHRPPQYYANGDWEWETVLDLAKKLTQDRNGDGITDVWALESPSGIVTDWVAKIHQFGGRVLNEEGTAAMIDQPEAIAGLTLWADTVHMHGVAPAWGQRAGANLSQGTLALFVRWAAEAVSVARVNEHLSLGLIPQPSGPAGSYHIAGGVPLTVSRSTQYPEEAAKFAIWYALYSDQWQLRGIPANRSVVAYEYREMVAAELENADAIMHAMSGPTGMEPHAGKLDLVGMWDPILHQLRAGNIAPEAAAQQIAEGINAILAQ